MIDQSALWALLSFSSCCHVMVCGVDPKTDTRNVETVLIWTENVSFIMAENMNHTRKRETNRKNLNWENKYMKTRNTRK